MTSHERIPVISLMLAVPDAATAVEWYKRALGATELWSLGQVAGLEIARAPFFLAQPAKNARRHGVTERGRARPRACARRAVVAALGLYAPFVLAAGSMR